MAFVQEYIKGSWAKTLPETDTQHLQTWEKFLNAAEADRQRGRLVAWRDRVAQDNFAVNSDESEYYRRSAVFVWRFKDVTGKHRARNHEYLYNMEVYGHRVFSRRNKAELQAAQQAVTAKLLDEYNSIIAPQKSALSQRLPQLFLQYYAPPQQLQPAGNVPNGAARPAAPGVKRPADTAAGPEAKKAKLPSMSGVGVSEFDKRQNDLLNQVKGIVNKLWQRKECKFFKEPVDPIKLGVPDYHLYIKHPMDLGTVKNKLNARQYKSPMEAAEDIRLVWYNCAKYNRESTEARKCGDTLADIWEHLWAESRIEDQWIDLMYQRDPQRALPHKVQQLSNTVKRTVTPLPGSELLPMVDGAVVPELSEVDKRKLSIALSEMQGEQLLPVLELLQSEMPVPDEGEVELDLDSLPAPLLHKLRLLVAQLVTGRAPPAMNRPVGNSKQAALAAAQQQQVMPVGAPGLQDPYTAAAAHNTGLQQQHGEQHVPQQQPQQQQHLMQQQQHPTTQSQQQHTMDGQDSMGAVKDEDMGEVASGKGSPQSAGESQGEVKGSTADNPHNSRPFVRMPQGQVDESATAPPAASAFLRDSAGVGQKAQVQVNAANWDVGDDAPAQPDTKTGDDEVEDDDDEMWAAFQTKEDRRKQQAEEQRKLQEQQEEAARQKQAAEEEALRRAANEAAEREQQLREEEARQEQDRQRARMEQCNKEVEDIRALHGTANLENNDMQCMQTLVEAQADKEVLVETGLDYKDDVDDVEFDSS